MKMCIVSAALALAAGTASAATLVSWDSTGKTGSEASMPATFAVANLTGTAFTEGVPPVVGS